MSMNKYYVKEIMDKSIELVDYKQTVEGQSDEAVQVNTKKSDRKSYITYAYLAIILVMLVFFAVTMTVTYQWHSDNQGKSNYSFTTH